MMHHNRFDADRIASKRGGEYLMSCINKKAKNIIPGWLPRLYANQIENLNNAS